MLPLILRTSLLTNPSGDPSESYLMRGLMCLARCLVRSGSGHSLITFGPTRIMKLDLERWFKVQQKQEYFSYEKQIKLRRGVKLE